MPDLVGGTILVVDDDVDLRTAMVRILERTATVTAAASAAEALAICRADAAIALVVADLGVTGPAFAAALAADRPSVRLIYVSGLSRAVAHRRGLVTGTDVLVVKPFTTVELRAAVRAALPP